MSHNDLGEARASVGVRLRLRPRPRPRLDLQLSTISSGCNPVYQALQPYVPGPARACSRVPWRRARCCPRRWRRASVCCTPPRTGSAWACRAARARSRRSAAALLRRRGAGEARVQRGRSAGVARARHRRGAAGVLWRRGARWSHRPSRSAVDWQGYRRGSESGLRATRPTPPPPAPRRWGRSSPPALPPRPRRGRGSPWRSWPTRPVGSAAMEEAACDQTHTRDQRRWAATRRLYGGCFGRWVRTRRRLPARRSECRTCPRTPSQTRSASLGGERHDMSDVGTRSRPHCKLPLGSGQLRRASRVHGAAQTQSLASQAAGVACFGTTKAISTC
eukprot:scaffold9038_cov54-Phaeocystis_antarctica.AAC.4